MYPTDRGRAPHQRGVDRPTGERQVGVVHAGGPQDYVTAGLCNLSTGNRARGLTPERLVRSGEHLVEDRQERPVDPILETIPTDSAAASVTWPPGRPARKAARTATSRISRARAAAASARARSTAAASSRSSRRLLCDADAPISVSPVHDLEIATAEWVDWYNHRRPHEYCDDLTPVQAEQAHYAHHQAPATAGVSN